VEKEQVRSPSVYKVMLSLIPIDVWIAAALAGTVVLLAFFGPSISAFAAIYIGLCVYIVIEIIYGELS
jgi:hypothetical protein